ncbi:MAG: FHA domain-containing protein [Victivallales bacterium]|nr:FHA domain-containing protein [Victivallales bacterium]
MAVEEIRFCTILAVRSGTSDPGSDGLGSQFPADSTAMLNMICLQFAGEELRTVGDVCLYAFARADDAARAACEMQREAACQREFTGREVGLRIGLDAGDVEKSGGSWRGRPLLRSARLSSLAPLGRVLAAAGLRSYLGRELRQALRPFEADAADTDRLGSSTYELPWDMRQDHSPDDEQPKTVMGAPAGTPTISLMGTDERLTPGALDVAAARRHLPLPLGMTEREGTPPPVPQPPAQPIEPRLCLIRGRHLIVVDARSPRATTGRSPETDIQIDIDTASRQHADIAYSGGRFVLTDHSWNGTYVYDAKGVGQLVHNDHLELPEEGYICPGTPKADEETSFRFRRADAPAPSTGED